MWLKCTITFFVVTFIFVKGDQWSSSNPTVFYIGGVLSNNDSAHYFKETILVS